MDIVAINAETSSIHYTAYQFGNKRLKDAVVRHCQNIFGKAVYERPHVNADGRPCIELADNKKVKAI